MNARTQQGISLDSTSRRRPGATARPSRFDVDTIIDSIRQFAGLSELLRFFGAAVLVASMSLFVLQGWADGNDVRRYLMLLTQTGLLAGAGFALSHGLGEAKGARVFFGLALVSVSANFTILGALIYSIFQWDGALTTYPAFAAWEVGTAANVGMTLAGALLVLVPVTLFGFAVMARHSARKLSLSFLAMNVMLLLPIRDSLACGAVALLGMFYALYFVRSAAEKDVALTTFEGRFALSTLFIPAGIVLFRMCLYEIDELIVVMLSAAAFLAARQAATFPGQSAGVSRALEVFSLPIAVVFGLGVADCVSELDVQGLGLPLGVVAYSAMALDVMRRTDSSRLAAFTGVSVSVFMSLSFVLTAAVYHTALTAALCLVAGIVMLLAGVTARNRTASVAGTLTLLGGAVFGYEPLLALVASSSWMDLAVFGAVTIVIGSVMDRHGAAIRLRFEKWFNAMNSRNEAIALDD